MSKWKQDFVVNTQRKRVQINFNGEFDNGKVLYVDPDWAILECLQAASQRLDMVPAAKRMFNADGVEIDDCMMIEDNDILFLSLSEDYIPPHTESNGTDSGSNNESRPREKLPPMIGGYKVLDLLGRGGFGEVRLGEHHLTGDRVALKFLRKSDMHSLGAAERTNTEIQCLTTLKHMNIIRLQQYMESVNHVVLVFELMEGGDLLQYLKQHARPVTVGKTVVTKSILNEDEARHLFIQVLSAVSYAHNQHICHRDLKLENILIKQPANLSLVKIADFGLSDFYRPGAMMKSNCGTLSFLAPEVLRGTSTAGPPLDVWSLGVILFAVLCGRLPFEGPDLCGTKRPRDAVIKTRIMKGAFKIDDNLSADVKDLIHKMLLNDPSERASIPEIYNHSWSRSMNNSFHYSETLLKPPVPATVVPPLGAPGSIAASSLTPKTKAGDIIFDMDDTKGNRSILSPESKDSMKSPRVTPNCRARLDTLDSPRRDNSSSPPGSSQSSVAATPRAGDVVPVSGSGKVMHALAELTRQEDADMFKFQSSTSGNSDGIACSDVSAAEEDFRTSPSTALDSGEEGLRKQAAIDLLRGGKETDSISDALEQIDLDLVPSLQNFRLTPLRRANSHALHDEDELDAITSRPSEVSNRNWTDTSSVSSAPSSTRPNTSSNGRRSSRNHYDHGADDDDESVKSSGTDYMAGLRHPNRNSSTAMRRSASHNVHKRDSMTGATNIEKFSSGGRVRSLPINHHSGGILESPSLSMSPLARVSKHTLNTGVSAGRGRSVSTGTGSAIVETRVSGSISAIPPHAGSGSPSTAGPQRPRFSS